MNFEISSKARPCVLVECMNMGARLVPHKTDPTKLVLKGPPDYAMNLAAHMKLDYTVVSEGDGRGEYHSVAVDKSNFLAALPSFLEEVLASNVPTADAPKTEEGPTLELVPSPVEQPTEEEEMLAQSSPGELTSHTATAHLVIGGLHEEDLLS